MNSKGRFGSFGGQYVPETLINPLIELEKDYKKYINDDNFNKEYISFLKDYVGRPSSLYFGKRLSEYFGGAKIYLKREDLNHTGAHKINNVIGQIMLADKMGKKKIIAEMVQDNMELLQLQGQLCLIWNVKFLWEKKILKDNK
jgi:tryptophan synthase beta chain